MIEYPQRSDYCKRKAAREHHRTSETHQISVLTPAKYSTLLYFWLVRFLIMQLKTYQEPCKEIQCMDG